MNDQQKLEMPEYVSHKRVHALEIKAIANDMERGDIVLELASGGTFSRHKNNPIFARYIPRVGDFLVQYEDGYFSFSPRNAFIDGYTRVDVDAMKAKAMAIDPERIAMLCHQANKALCEAFGDMSQPEWKDAPQWQKESAVAGVKFCLENPAAPPSANHDNWTRQKVTDGWVYGPVKDPANKRHPCLVPFEQLPADQRAKDHVFKAIVAAMA